MSLYSKLSNPWRGPGNSGFEAKLDRMLGSPDSSAHKESACNAGDPSLISGLGRSAGEGIGYPLQYPGLENSMDRGAWQAIVHGFSERFSLSFFFGADSSNLETHYL